MTALGRSPFRARNTLMNPSRQCHGDEDVFLPGHYQGRGSDLAKALARVMALDPGELREVLVDRLVHVLHRSLELGEFGTALLEERHRECPQRDVAHDERD